jgi:hypothetical protein
MRSQGDGTRGFCGENNEKAAAELKFKFEKLLRDAKEYPGSEFLE